jgi:hypothetical protein
MGSPQFDPTAYAENIAGHALVGCASSVASGGSCGSGAAGAAVSAGLTPVTRGLFPNASSDLGQRIDGTIVQATAGGLASVAGGGKFANGAVTGAFGYLVALGPMSSDPTMHAMACGPACPALVGGALLTDALVGTSIIGTVLGWFGLGITAGGAIIYMATPAQNAWDPDGPKARISRRSTRL